MNARRDPDQLIHTFLMEGQTELADPVFDAVRATIEQKRQRVVIGPWRFPDMSRLLAIGLGAAAVVVVLVGGIQLFGPAPGGVGGAPSAEPTPTPSPPPVGGIVEYQFEGAPATTEVTATADGESVSGTAVTTFSAGSRAGTHTVRLECAVRQGDRWAFVGTIEQTTISGETAGAWSAVVVEDGTPPLIGIVFGIEKLPGEQCAAKWGSMDMAPMDVSNPVESGALVPPPDLAP